MTGLILIDRSDELNVLFERSHALDTRLRAGTIALQQQEKEVCVVCVCCVLCVCCVCCNDCRLGSGQ